MYILLVDDHFTSVHALARLLRHQGHTVWMAGSIMEALASAALMPSVDLLISDLGLPDGDGLTLPKLLRGRCAGNPPNAFAVTGRDESYTREAYWSAGYGSSFQKPLALDQLLSAIDRLPAPLGAELVS